MFFLGMLMGVIIMLPPLYYSNKLSNIRKQTLQDIEERFRRAARDQEGHRHDAVGNVIP